MLHLCAPRLAGCPGPAVAPSQSTPAQGYQLRPRLAGCPVAPLSNRVNAGAGLQRDAPPSIKRRPVALSIKAMRRATLRRIVGVIGVTIAMAGGAGCPGKRGQCRVKAGSNAPAPSQTARMGGNLGVV